MSGQHTLGPWELRGSRLITDRHGVVISEEVRAGNRATGEENAAFIVRACNAHEGLVDLLTEAKKYLKERSYTWQEIDALCLKIDNAIKEG